MWPSMAQCQTQRSLLPVGKPHPGALLPWGWKDRVSEAGDVASSS